MEHNDQGTVYWILLKQNRLFIFIAKNHENVNERCVNLPKRVIQVCLVSLMKYIEPNEGEQEEH